MAWLKVLAASLIVAVNLHSSTGVIVTKNGKLRPATRAPTAASVSGSGSVAEIIEALSASASASGSGSVSFAEVFNVFSSSGSGSSQSSRPSKSSKSSSVSSVNNVSVKVSSGSSSNYSALVTVGSGRSFEIATPLTAKSSVVPVYRNWVGPRSVQGDAACWREAHVMDKCPSNYDRNEATNTCWTEC
ncbi:hypothetical protein PR003_g30190, partial [Phytophthora rubi]